MIRPQHWIVALVIALALHLGVFAYVNFNAPVATAAAEGALGVEIDLGMLGDLGEAEETEQPEEVAPPKPTPPPPPPPPPPPEPPRQ
ncbi:MAG TPA: energy transducer TonB, partial [Pseudomonas pachastrellae]|nr:energy transducer TonB [Halopseudomonas pachastrellae]